MFSSWIVVLGWIAISSLASSAVIPQTENSAWDAIKQLKKDPKGYVHIADDGVARSYTGDDNVVDYVPLTNGQLSQILTNLPELWQKESEHLHSVFDNVDGRDVVSEKQLLDPLHHFAVSRILKLSSLEFQRVTPSLSYFPETGTANVNPAPKVQHASS